MRRALVTAAALLSLTACAGLPGTAAPGPTVTVTVTAAASPVSPPTGPARSSPPSSPTGTRSGGRAKPTPSEKYTDAARPVVAPGGRKCPDHPTPACTGLPPGTKLRKMEPNDGPAYRVRKAGTVLDGVHITQDLLIAADNVKILNSRIDGGIMAEFDGRHYVYSVADTTIGPEKGCLTAPAVGAANYTVERVLIRGHADGFRDSGDSIVIKDSYARLCAEPGRNYSDGLQTYNAGRGLLLDHTTLDMRGVVAHNSPIFFNDKPDGTRDVTITNNLVMGGNFTIQLHNIHGRLVVQNNRVVDRTWEFAPVSGDCLDTIRWANNHIVTIDAHYRVTSIVRPLTCNGD
ncbi:hypothetical protein [Nonomuraea lactucae]|uniref:hypothetical protein n=1 Tax=Nonomuraea lactucae TaxID=2249762 RepID=UPI0013B365C7|nr:hypothetical protein [Nonomuraea lactucae]